MTTETGLMTAEEYWDQSSKFGRSELIDGRVVVILPASRGHNRTITKTARRLDEYVSAQGLGEVLSGDTGIMLRRNPDRVRAPDVCFIAAARLAADVPDTGWLEVIPDLVVEVISPGDTMTEVQQKTEEWLRAGVRLVLNLNPQTRTVVASQSLDADRIYHAGDTLTCDPVLPDFSVQVADLFR
ncbi:MAG: Uma2 family endonuclease [Dehalococcoidia bacterium]